MKFFKYLFTLSGNDPADEQRRQLLNIVIIFTVLLVFVIDIIAALVMAFVKTRPVEIFGMPLVFVVSCIVLIFCVFIFFLNRKLSGPLPSLLFLVIQFLVLLSADLPEQVMGGRGLLMFVVPIILSSFLLVPYASFIASGIVYLSLSWMSVVTGRVPEFVSMSVYFLLAFGSWIIARNLRHALGNLFLTNRELASELVRTKEKDAALEASRLHSQAIFENTLNSVFLVNERAQIVDVNPAAVRLTGIEKSGLIGTEIWNLIYDLSANTKNAIQDTARKIGKIKGTARLCNASGRIIDIDYMGVMNILPGIHLAVFWDIMDRIESERALHDSRELLKKTLESLKAAIFIVEAKKETIIEMNNAALEVFGYTKEELCGNTTEMLHINSASWETFRAHFQLALQRKGFLGDFQYRMKRKDGTIFPTEHTVTPLFDDAGERTGWVSVVRDITERKKLEEQVVHAQKMEALGRLAGGITHDFNNLLTTIFGYCDIGRMNPGIDNLSTECFTEIKKASERAAALTGQLLAFSRKQILTLKTIRINDLILNMKTLLGRLVVEDITIEYILEGNIDPIKADPVQVEQILVNMIVNACDAMESGGVITIETKNCYLDESYGEHHPDIEAGHYVMLGISDTGNGMDEKTLKRVFDPFFTTKEHGKGTGLSLAIVFGIVKQSGGHIYVYSEIGKGTTFKLYFPLDISASEGKVVTIPESLGKLSGKEKILVIEDDEALRKVVVRTLSKFGYVVSEARTGNDALSLCSGEGCTDRFDLVITDVIMPGLSGKETAEKLVRMFPGLKVIFVSGYTDNVIVNHGIKNGEKVFLQKPFSPDDIARKVRETLDGSIKN
jgi:two-component system, cell cycle sensor histidine kinase and response regulator CckA